MEQGNFPEQAGMKEPSKEEISDYFKRLGLRFRDKFKILKDPTFEVSGAKAKREGWFLGYHSIVEAAVVAKVADLIELPGEERTLLLESALMHHANKRRQYERGKNVNTEGYSESQADAAQHLIAFGIDPRVIEINKGVGPEFIWHVARGDIEPGTGEHERIYWLTRYISYIHNTIETTPDRANHTQTTEIVSWRERLRLAAERHPEIASEKERIGDQELSYFDIEGMITGETEEMLKKEIQKKNPDVHIPDDMELSQWLRGQIMNDIQNGKEIAI